MGGKKKISIYMPAYSEERAIGSMVALAKKYGKVHVIDDGSNDRTVEIAIAAGAECISHEKNRGYGASLKTAIEHARKSDADAIVFIDADYQHDPDDIPKVAEPVLLGRADVCLGSRFSGKFINAPMGRRESVGALNFLNSTRAKNKVHDYECGFRAFSKKAIEKISAHDDGYAACSEMIVNAINSGLKIEDVPVSAHYYRNNNGKDLVHGAGIMKYIASETMKRKPLLIFAIAGCALLALSALFGIFVVNTFYSTNTLPTGSAFLTVFTGILGMIVISIGINVYTLEAILEKRMK